MANQVKYKKFYEENRIALMQYKSLRENFNQLAKDVLGDDYYNMGMDVYECDRIVCEDVAIKVSKYKKVDKFLKFVFGY